MNEIVDPYRAPGAQVFEVAAPRPLHLAGKWRRFLTLLVDSLGLGLIGFVLGMVTALVVGVEAIENMGFGLRLLLNVGCGLSYYIGFEYLFNRTPGKWICGTVVVDEDGNRPSFKQVLNRSLCRYIPFEALSFLGEGPGWHDTIPKTRVVMAR